MYRQCRPVYWSPSSATALAEAELEYDENHISTAAFIKFPLTKVPEALSHVDKAISALVWTTTPWTLPANKAIAVDENLPYSLVEEPGSFGKRLCLVGKPLIGKLQEMLSSPSPLEIVVESIRGSSLTCSAEYVNVFQGINGSPQPFINADFVSASTGTGLVHVAPGHGMDDYRVCSSLGIPLSSPIDDQSRYTVDACPHSPTLLAGLDVLSDGVRAVIRFLRDPPVQISSYYGDLVLATHDHRHKYPIDWRTKQPVIVRATEQYFADLRTIRADIVEALQTVRFQPESSELRLRNSVLRRTEWCISRQRAWGVPIPTLYRRNESGTWDSVMTSHSVAHIIQMIEDRGVDAWWADREDDLAWLAPGLGTHTYRRGKDTMDVWFDSGTSWTLLAGTCDGDHVADVYLEGSDQHRGWFQSSLLTYVAHQSGARFGKNRKAITAPYRTLITHGFALDHNGFKMSKSVGNVITPAQIISGNITEHQRPKKPAGKKHIDHGNAGSSLHEDTNQRDDDPSGADTLRLWVASCDYTKDVPISQDVVKSVHRNIQKLRMTLKWLLGVLDPLEPSLAVRLRDRDASGRFADTLILHCLHLTGHAVHAAYGSYNHARAVAAINNFINHDLSTFYIETAKDRLYADSSMERAAAQHVLLVILEQILCMIGPITPMLVEEAVAHTPQQLKQLLSQKHQAEGGGEPDWHPLRSVWHPYTLHSPGTLTSQHLSRQFTAVQGVRAAVHTGQNLARTQGKIGSSLDCVVQIVVAEETLCDPNFDVFAKLEDYEWSNLLVVSGCETLHVVDEGSDDGTHASVQDPQTWSFRVPIYVKDSLDGGLTAEGDWGKRPIGTAVVKPARDHKCPRCWRRAAPEAEKVCKRCETVLREMGVDSTDKGIEGAEPGSMAHL